MKHIATIDDNNFLTRGEIQVIASIDKYAKRELITDICSKYLSNNNHLIPTNFLQLEIENSIINKVLVIETNIDTIKEDSIPFKIMQQMEITEFPNNLLYQNVKGYSFIEKLDILNIELSNIENNLKLVIIDNLSDFVDNVNDEIQAYKLIDSLSFFASQLNIPIVVGIELLKSDKPLGHLGTQLERKCSAFVEVKPPISELHDYILKTKYLRYS